MIVRILVLFLFLMVSACVTTSPPGTLSNDDDIESPGMYGDINACENSPESNWCHE